MFLPLYEPMSLEYKKNSRAKEKPVEFNGYQYFVENHDGTIDTFILTDITRTIATQYRIPIKVGVPIQTANGRFIIDSLMIHPDENNYVARVSPLAA